VSPHLIHRPVPRHAALPGLLPDGGPGPLPRERGSWRAGVLQVLELVLFVLGLHPGTDDRLYGAEDPDAPPAATAVRLPGVQLPRVRPAHIHVPHLHVPHIAVAHIPALAGRILHRGAHPAAAPGLTPAAAACVPAAPTAAGPATLTGNALGVPLLGAPLVPVGRYLPGEDPRTTTAQLHALSESALTALDLHYQAIRDACGRLDALALTPLPSDQPEPPQPTAAPATATRPPAIEYPPFATGARRAPAPMRQHGQELLALPQAAARHAGTAAAEIVIGGLR